MDLGLPGMGGVEGIRKLRTFAPKITVVVLTVFEEKKIVFQALDAGAAGYLLKTATGPEIIQGLKQVFMGGATLSPSIAKLMLEQFHKPSPSKDFHLTEREVEVLEELAKGLAIKEIADVLGISRSTVATHLEKIYTKLHVQSQSGAVAKALRSGII
jgi:DNA-binding NarL/FixJ family response regulator